MNISCWNRLYRGTLLRLVFSQLCPLLRGGDLVSIVDHMSGNVAHVAVPAGKLWFLGKSRSNPLFMGEGVGGRFGLAWTNVDFRELVSKGKLLGKDGPCQPHGGVFRKNSGLGATGVQKMSGNDNFLLDSPI